MPEPLDPIRGAPPERRTGGARTFSIAVAVAGLAALAGGLWFAYADQDGGGGPPPLIAADKSPTKVQPENPGGLQVRNTDKELHQNMGRGGSAGSAPPGTISILPPPERPLPTPKVEETPAAPAPAAEATAAPPPPAPAVTAVAPQAQPQPPAPAQPPRSAPAAAAPPAAPAPGPSAAAPRPLPAGAVRIQLGAHRDMETAEREWARLQRRHAAELQGLGPAFERADLGARGIFYRLQAGPLPSRDAAQQVCDRLKAAKQDCNVVR